jgi:NAD+ kinase
MQIALFGRRFNPDYLPVIARMVRILEKNTEIFYIKDTLYQHLMDGVSFTKPVKLFENHSGLPSTCFCMISIGGDGTLLDTLPLVRNSGIPVLGINTGRLGFLSSVSTDEMDSALQALMDRNFRIDQRSLIKLDAEEELFGSFPYALNELTILKRENTTMIAISAYVNDLYLNTYWADGLMVSTPTGSTGYSLSCAGPIISPDSETFVITPVASHNLTVRPIIIKDDSVVKLRVEGRVKNHLIVMDSRSVQRETPIDLYITRAGFKVNIICLENNDFFKTIRNKLAWGFDKRN